MRDKAEDEGDGRVMVKGESDGDGRGCKFSR